MRNPSESRGDGRCPKQRAALRTLGSASLPQKTQHLSPANGTFRVEHLFSLDFRNREFRDASWACPGRKRLEDFFQSGRLEGQAFRFDPKLDGSPVGMLNNHRGSDAIEGHDSLLDHQRIHDMTVGQNDPIVVSPEDL